MCAFTIRDDNFVESVLSIHLSVGSGRELKVVRLAEHTPLSLPESHPTSPSYQIGDISQTHFLITKLD